MAITINGDGLIDIGGTTSTQGRVRLAEDVDNGTNYVELTAPASVAANRTITFPDATTTVVGTDATQTLTNKTLTSPTINGGTVSSATVTSSTLTSPTIGGTPVVSGSLIVSGTPITVSGTAPTISGIPSWAKRVVLLLAQVSTNGANGLGVRLGTSSGIDSTTTYNNLNHILGASGVDRYGTATGAPYNSIFSISAGTSFTSAGMFFNGQLTFSLIDTNLWVVSGVVSTGNVAGSMYTFLSTGSKSLSSALTQIQLTTTTGVDQFDAGTINIIYE
jgi:hypothetical protein